MFYDVIVIDSGCNVAQAEYVDMVNLTQNINPYDSIGHGSSIISIIKQKAPNIKILSVKISDSFDDVDLDSIIDALEFLIDNNYSCNIINMSLGTLTLSDIGKMKRLIDDLLNKGAVIVSSFNNDGYNSYPAVFDNVIGIDSTDECNNENDYYYLENCNVNVLGAFIYYRAKNHLNESTMVKGNSYTAANVTGIISNALHLKSSEKNNLTLTKTILFQQAKKVYKIKGYIDSAKDGKEFVSQIKKAIVFPFNKEIHAIAKYESLINFEVVDYYDVRISGHVGNKISNINEFIDNEKVVKNITDLDWSGDFDTIICGHCGQLSKLLGKDLLEDIVQKCNKHRKLLYSFDSLSKYDYNFDQQSSCCFYSPVIEKQNVPLKNFGKLYISSKPVIGVYGTSSSQGKYSLQLQMRKILQENDYNVSQIGTEPSGYLFNMSFSYPIGYNSSVSISNYDAVLILNNELHTIEANGCDIIITGAQSASVPYEPRCVTNISFATNDLLMGTLPDIIILCVNFDDDTEYIKRTINYLESYTNSKVLGVVMYPFKLSNKNFINKTKVNNNELNNKIETLRNQIQKNVYKYEELNVLCENIIDYFSA